MRVAFTSSRGAASSRTFISRRLSGPPSSTRAGHPQHRARCCGSSGGRSSRRARRGWTGAPDSLRPNLIPLWRALPLVEQKRALRHLRPYWDTHRHRIAPEIDARLRKLEPERRLRFLAGSLVAARVTREALEIDFRRRAGAEIETLRADWLINCTGPTTAYERIDDPFVRALLDKGLARPDDVGLGIEVTRDCNVIGADGRPHDRLFATGPLTRGAFWEMLAVPELRRQAPEVARRILETVHAVIGAEKIRS
jgi:uncharacterized NAD(P)/FAD-binding protein YdhS